MTYGNRGAVGRPDADHHAINRSAASSAPDAFVGESLDRHPIKINLRARESLPAA